MVSRVQNTGSSSFHAVSSNISERADRIRELADFPCTKNNEVIIGNLICSTGGARLAELLANLDEKNDPSVEDIVFHRIDSREVRERILSHLQKHRKSTEVAVVSDFDDTAVPSVDKRFGDRFPGVATLYSEIDRAAGGRTGDLHFVTARPGFVAHAPRKELPKQNFPKASIEASDWGPYLNKMGKALLTPWRLGKAWGEAVYEGKIRNVENLLKLHPHQPFVFFGDSVQFDPEVYAEIRRRHPQRVKAIVIHEVPGTDMSAQRFKDMNITTTALESARALFSAGVIDQAAVDRVELSILGAKILLQI
jgi:Uncharacterized conserved protein (DUF2183)